MTPSNFLDSHRPWKQLPWVVAIGLLLRLLVVALTERSLHSDEIFQYVEQAHRLTYGYGYTTWEYVHGIRSWLLPGAISLVLSGCRLLGLNEPALYIPVVQTLACLISLSAIYCAYWIGRSVCSESVGRLASVLTAGWYEMVIRANTLTPEILGGYLVMGAVTCLVIKPSYRSALSLGLCGAGAVALRLQYAPVVVLGMVIALAQGWRKHWSLGQGCVVVAGFAAVIGFVGWLDHYTWGSYFASYDNNYLYNKVYGISSRFGEDPVWGYLADVAMYSGGVFWVAIATVLFSRRPKPWLLLAVLGAVIVPHSAIAHKEYRFIFAAVPICLLLSAIAIDMLWMQSPQTSSEQPPEQPPEYPSQRLLPKRRRNGGKFILGLMAFYTSATLIVTSFFLDPQANQLQAYLYLHDQPALVSVLNISTSWYNTGGYYYLHRDVPIYVEKHLETIPPADWARYISHVVCDHGQAPIPEFSTVAQFGDVDIRIAKRSPTETLAIETRYPPQDGVTGVYEPTVTPRF
jgi:GPI mannosyltransferase 3